MNSLQKLTLLCIAITLSVGAATATILFTDETSLWGNQTSPAPAQLAEINASQSTVLGNVDNTVWQTITLPHDWAEQRFTEQHLWYRIPIPELLQEETLAVYIPTVIHSAKVFVNDVWVGGAENKTDITRLANRPQYFEFSSQLLTEDNNFLYLRVSAAIANQGLLSNVFIDTRDKLFPQWQAYHKHRYQLLESITIFMVFCGCVLLLFWRARPRDKEYGYFGITLLFWSLFNGYWLLPHAPLPLKHWEALHIFSMSATVVFNIITNHHTHHFLYIHLKKYLWQVEKYLLTYLMLGLLLFILPSVESVQWWGYKVWLPINLIIGLYGTAYLVLLFYYVPKFEHFFIPSFGIIILLFGLHDQLLFNNLWDRTEGIYVQYLTVPLGLLFSLTLMNNFIDSLKTTESLLQNLEQRIKEKEEELINKYEQIKQLEYSQLLVKERERIMRDMHDGIGGQLLGILSSIEGKTDKTLTKIKTRVQNSLIDLRIVIDSLDSNISDIGVLLGNLRQRIQQQLVDNEITLIWDVQLLPTDKILKPQQSLHLMRIIQEAINNCCKHARTSHVHFYASQSADEKNIIISIRDEGIGIINKEPTRGHGMRNMHYRAQQIQAAFDIKSSEKGTEITLILPI